MAQSASTGLPFNYYVSKLRGGNYCSAIYELKLARFSANLRIQVGAECGKKIKINVLSEQNNVYGANYDEVTIQLF